MFSCVWYGIAFDQSAMSARLFDGARASTEEEKVDAGDKLPLLAVKPRRSGRVYKVLSFLSNALVFSLSKGPRAGLAQSKASSLSSAEVRRLWEEPTEETGPSSGSVGILSINGEEDGKEFVDLRLQAVRCSKLRSV